MKFHRFLLIAFFLIISGCCKTYQSNQDYYQITLDDDYPDAEKIVVYGNFTNYSKFETIFGKENGKWVCRVDLKPGRYYYQFLIINKDGTQQWLFDPNNPDQGRHIDGYDYSFLEVE